MANLPPNRSQGTGKVSPKHSKSKHKSQVVRAKHPQKPFHTPKPKAPTVNKNDQPLFPGGITTYGDFIKQRKAAADAQFAPQEQALNEQARNIPAWYNDYLAKLQGLQQQTAEQYQGLQAQASSLDQPVQGSSEQANAAATARANLIKAMTGSLITQQGAQSNYLGNMGAIAGAKRLQAEGDIGKQRESLAKQRGDFYTNYTAKARQQEFENALAASQFDLKEQQTKADIEATKAAAKSKETTYDKEFSKQAAKYGFDPHDWALLGPRGRAKRIAEAQRKSGQAPKTISRIEQEEAAKTAAHHGYTIDEWKKLTPGQRSEIIRGGKDKSKKQDGTELSFRTGEQMGKVTTAAAHAKQVADKLVKGEGIGGINKQGHKRSRADAAKILLSSKKSPEPVVVSAVLDAAYQGYISRETASRLHDSHIKVQELAQALGVPTYSEWAKKHSGVKVPTAGPF